MEIGGKDINILRQKQHGDVNIVMKAIAKSWPNAFVEYTQITREPNKLSTYTLIEKKPLKWEKSEYMDYIFNPIPEQATEVFIYYDKAAQESWEADGLTEDNADKMIFLTFEDDCIACVIKEDPSNTSQIIEDIKEELTRNQSR